MRIPFLSKRKRVESPASDKPKKQKPKVLTAYEESKQRQETYTKRLNKKF